MRVLHTSDWHLGHRLHRRSRHWEHQRFLDWLLERLVDQEIDVLLIAGDVFDTANPPTQALELWYSFLAACAKIKPELRVLVVGGNHDSAARLDAPGGLLSAFHIEVVGGARKDGELRSPEEMVMQIPSPSSGQGKLWVAAVPFLRPVDLPQQAWQEGQDPLIEGVRAFYQAVFDSMQANAAPGDHLLAMGHLYLRKGQLSELSERKILGGNQHALPADVFPSWLDYVALGHLHRAQSVQREEIRYCGSPIPLAMDERHYRHEVTLLCLEPKGRRIESIRVPRAIPLLRVPDQGSASLPEVLAALDSALSQDLGSPPESARSAMQDTPLAFIEVAVRLTEPDPDLRATIESACEAHGHQLCSLLVEYAGAQTSLGEQVVEQELAQLQPQDVLRAMYEASYGEAIDESLVGAFEELVESLDQEGAPA